MRRWTILRRILVSACVFVDVVRWERRPKYMACETVFVRVRGGIVDSSPRKGFVRRNSHG